MEHLTQSDHQIKWDKRYLNLAKEVASWSKDPSTQVGAVAVGPKGQVLSQGYNGFPRGISDNPERLANRELKYRYIVHAEMNAIYNASFNGVSLAGSTMYIHGLPCCSECAKGLIQVGIKRIVMPKRDVPDKWKDSWHLSNRMFGEAHVEIDWIHTNE
jgi:dCMP deaminase